jgi:hypothetical protein
MRGFSRRLVLALGFTVVKVAIGYDDRLDGEFSTLHRVDVDPCLPRPIGIERYGRRNVPTLHFVHSWRVMGDCSAAGAGTLNRLTIRWCSDRMDLVVA